MKADTEDCRSDGDRHQYCSLAEAVSLTNGNEGPDRIELEPGGVYTLATIDHQKEGGNGLPAIEGALIIEGQGAVIERDRDFETPEFRLFRVASEGELTLRGVQLRNGATPRGYDGAAIWSTGTLILENVVLEDNHSGDDGGAIRSDGRLEIRDSLIRNNTARWRGGVGGGLQNPEQFGKANALIERTTFVDNEAWAGGGAVWLEGSVLMRNVTVTGNRAGKRGGGIENYGQLELRNCTIVNNQAGVDGGGMHSFRPVKMSNTILTSNRAMISSDCDTKLISGGYNLLGDMHRCLVEGDPSGNLVDTRSGLAPLAEMDGAWLHVPRPGSPAIDQGNPETGGEFACELVDQLQRNRSEADGRCDIGAVEFFSAQPKAGE